jgi:energy-coupling factor transporter transmembrane protein EcfT
MYLTLLFALFSAVGLGLLISTLVKNSNTVIYIILVILFVQLIFCGTLFPLPDAANPLSYATSSRWAIEALGSSIDMDRLNKLGEFRVEELNKDVKSQMDFLVNYDRNPAHLLTTWGVLLGLGILSIILAMVFLKAQDKK